MHHIPYNKPFITGLELKSIESALEGLKLSGDGAYTAFCHNWLNKYTRTPGASFLTHSCTSALEISALALNLQPGDEVILPSYTFVSTANAFVLRGAIPVFVDIRPDTQNIDENLIEGAITNRTKAIVPVHYAGIACEMDAIMHIAAKHNLTVIEDAAQALMSSYKGLPLGGVGDFGAFSFHETKNIISGEGGSLTVKSRKALSAVEIIREKGTDRSKFQRGELDKYTWRSLGSSYLPSEITAAFLSTQLESAEKITEIRRKSWDYYNQILFELVADEYIKIPMVPTGCKHNGHIYYILLSPRINRDALIGKLHSDGIGVASHYVPLHSSPAGRKYGRVYGSMEVTNLHSNCLLRLPLWAGITQDEQDCVVRALREALHHQ